MGRVRGVVLAAGWIGHVPVAAILVPLSLVSAEVGRAVADAPRHYGQLTVSTAFAHGIGAGSPAAATIRMMPAAGGSEVMVIAAIA